MCGTGVGFSVEKEFIDQMPVVKPYTGVHVGTHVVGDEREGWANALKLGLETWFDGKDVDFDVSKVRPKGARLKTMGGRASGPEPLVRLLVFCRDIITKAQGRKLESIEWLDIGNYIGEVVVVGGVRRSSQINFSDLEDEKMRHAKDWPFPLHRSMSNNSVCYKERPNMTAFMKEWASLAASGSGERGIFNLKAANDSSPRREKSQYFRGNPCNEIVLRADQGEFCNLSEIVIRSTDKFDDLLDKVKAATWIGAMQSCLTDFPYIRPSFKEICDKERLLGVSLTGQMDNPKLMTPEKLEILRDYALKECKKAAKLLDIPMSVAVTTGKPSGTVSQLTNCASGAHPRYAPHYIRRYRISSTDPLFFMMKDQGFNFSPENGQRKTDVDLKRQALLDQGVSGEEALIRVPEWNESQVMTWVVEFPEASPKNAITRDKMTAIDQLEWYLKLKKHWCEHNISITVYVREDEWLKVGSFVYEHFDEIVGVSFLPYDSGSYEQAPYEEITKDRYEELVKKQPKIDYSLLVNYENDDNTSGAKALACSGDSCELK
jgi:ribonucleoside-diphosphate reductase alpha chain